MRIGRCKGLILAALIAVLSSPALVAEKGDAAEHTTLATYSTSGGSPASTSTRKTYCDELAAYVWAIVPRALRGRISGLSFFRVKDGAENAADGIADSDDRGRWQLGLDYDMAMGAVVDKDADQVRDFEEVLAHELGHVISLDQDQEAREGDSAGYTLDEVPYGRDAYITAFYLQFWKGRYPGWAPRDDTGEAAAGLFERHRDSFVTEYAATDPGEDFAESFAFFVQGPRPEGRELKAKKLQFFYAYPLLVRFRDSMRKSMQGDE